MPLIRYNASQRQLSNFSSSFNTFKNFSRWSPITLIQQRSSLLSMSFRSAPLLTKTSQRSPSERHSIRGGNESNTYALRNEEYSNPVVHSHHIAEVRVQGSGKLISQASKKRFRPVVAGPQDDSSSKVFHPYPRVIRQRRNEAHRTLDEASNLAADELDSQSDISDTSSTSSAQSVPRSNFGKYDSKSAPSENRFMKSNQRTFDDFELDPSKTNATHHTDADDSASDDSDAESESASDESVSNSSSSESASDTEWKMDAEPSDRMKIIYFATSSRVTAEKSSTIKEMLRADLPNTVVILETAMQKRSAPYSNRKALNRLMTEVFDGNVSEIVVADSAHICSTKDGFQLFSWVCGRFGTEVLISPELQKL